MTISLNRWPNTAQDRNFRNNTNQNWDTLEKNVNSFEKDITKTKYDVEVAQNQISKAENKSEEAIELANNVQKQVNEIVKTGDSSVEAAQARTDDVGTTHTSLKARIDSDVIKLRDRLDAEIYEAFDFAKIFQEHGTKLVVTGDSLSYNRYDFMPDPVYNGYECLPGIRSWSFMLHDAIHENDKWFVRSEDLLYRFSNPITVSRNGAADYTFGFSGRYTKFAGMGVNEEITFSYKHANTKSNMIVIYLPMNPGTTACTFDVYLNGNKVTTFNTYGRETNGTLKDYQGLGLKPIVINAPAGEYDIKFSNFNNVHGGDYNEIQVYGIGSKYSPIYLTGSGSKTSAWLLENLQERVIKYEADVVMIIIGANDKKLDTPENFERNLNSIIEKIKAWNVRSKIILMVPPNESTVTESTNKRFADIIRKVSDKRKTFLFDVEKTFRNFNSRLEWQYDSIHLNKRGNTYLANAIIANFFPSLIHDSTMINSNVFYSGGNSYKNSPVIKGAASFFFDGDKFVIYNKTPDKSVVSVGKVNNSTIRVNFKYNISKMNFINQMAVCGQFGDAGKKFQVYYNGCNDHYIEYTITKVDGTAITADDWTTANMKFWINY
ncbi:SGNH/GDSL hydrolase family protein [Bacillus pacificus]|uniref:GDSL-type esterase/lipase family protein n=1 Tax=Bacillus cereus group TaxID=86661 RepID=UPI002236B74C|nr:SGNH/GDSL hydrolase family protein [Bacillus pacificus]